MYINVNTTALKRKTNEINSHVQTSVSAVMSVKNIVNNISNIWQGKDNDLFSLQLSDFAQELQKLYSSIETYSDFVKGYDDAVVKLDEEFGGKKIEIK